jgi:hypothetical protein
MADKDTLLDGVEGLLHWSVPWFKSQFDSLVSAAKKSTTWIGSHQPQEEEVFILQTLCQGQGQGQVLEVETSSIASCFGSMLSAQIKQESSTSGS